MIIRGLCLRALGTMQYVTNYTNSSASKGVASRSSLNVPNGEVQILKMSTLSV